MLRSGAAHTQGMTPIRAALAGASECPHPKQTSAADSGGVPGPGLLRLVKPILSPMTAQVISAGEGLSSRLRAELGG